MSRILLSISVGALLGGVAVLATIDRRPATTLSSTRSIISCPTTVADDSAGLVRSSALNQPSGVQSVKQALTHGSEFARKRALYDLADGTGSETLQKLIFDASQLRESNGRREALSIFIDRLTELDPRSALALARLDTISRNKTILQRVWQHWAAEDLESALQESVRLPDAFDRDVAVQAMFNAYGNMNNATIQRISFVTGISPDLENRRRYFYRLADQAPASAFDHANKMDSAHKQREAIVHLAHYLVQRDGSRAAQYATLITSPLHRNQYLAFVIGRTAELNPQSAIFALSSVDDAEKRYELHNQIIGRVAWHDAHLAKQLADQLVDTRTRDLAYYNIIEHHARHDPVEAAGWAALIMNQQVRQYAEQQAQRAVERNSPLR